MKSRLPVRRQFGLLIATILGTLLIPQSLAQEGTPRPRRGTPVIPPDLLPPLRDFDVVATSFDCNGFALNPKWGRQVRDGILPFQEDNCPPPAIVYDPREWSGSRWPMCTSCPVSFNFATEWFSDPTMHHVNFMPVTYKGRVTWNGTGRTVGDMPIWPFGDYDYTFNLERPDQALYDRDDKGVTQVLHIEFDARETVDMWEKADGRTVRTWWRSFHDNGVGKGDYQAQMMIDGHFAIVVGLLGLDAPHSGKPELHPVYAMFVRVEGNWRARQTSWAFFVRNWGNEGYCGYDQMNLRAQLIKVQIPHPAETMDAVVYKGARNADDLSAMRVTAAPNRDGMLLSFVLLPAEKQSWFVGDAIFRGSVIRDVPEARTSFRRGLRSRTAREPEERIPPRLEALRSQIAKLPEASRRELFALQENTVARTEGGQQRAEVVISAPTQTCEAELPSPGQVVCQSDLVVSRKDAAREVERRKQREVLRRFFSERGIHTGLPPQN